MIRAVILDPGLEVSARARDVLVPLGVRVEYACSAAEAEVVLARAEAPLLLVACIGDEVSSWEVAERAAHLPSGAHVLALVPALDDPGVARLRALPGVRCFARPDDPAGIDALLKESIDAADPRVCWTLERPDEIPAYHGIVGQSPAIREICARIQKIAEGDVTACIYGESGTGKEMIAYAIHSTSRRRDRVFIPLDCSAIPEGLMESHLFGHVKGAFTGAVDNHEGVFAQADGGTLFIDELCEMPLPIQVKLLRVLQAREFVPVGGTKPIRTNIRLITATNKDPKQEVEKGRFREDLYYRVAVIMIRVPPLRERVDDIPALVSHFARKFSETHAKPIVGVERAAMERLASSSWPGNIRQLENVIEQAVVLTDGDVLRERDLFGDDGEEMRLPASRLELEPGLPLREVERLYILRTIEATRGNRSEAARRLGISLRALQYKLKSYRGEVNPPGSSKSPIGHSAMRRRSSRR